MKCEHCSKEYTSKIGFGNHTRRCPNNPGRIIETLTDVGRESIRSHSVAQNKKQWADLEFRKKHSESMKNAVRDNPGSYTSSNRGRTKQIEIDGLKLQGQWEVDFYLWAKKNNLCPERPNTSFKYQWNGERWYHPDFYLPSLNLYVEVKGYETDRDRAKWSHFPHKLAIIKAKEIAEIRNGTYNGLIT